MTTRTTLQNNDCQTRGAGAGVGVRVIRDKQVGGSFVEYYLSLPLVDRTEQQVSKAAQHSIDGMLYCYRNSTTIATSPGRATSTLRPKNFLVWVWFTSML